MHVKVTQIIYTHCVDKEPALESRAVGRGGGRGPIERSEGRTHQATIVVLELLLETHLRLVFMLKMF